MAEAPTVVAPLARHDADLAAAVTALETAWGLPQPATGRTTPIPALARRTRDLAIAVTALEALAGVSAPAAPDNVIMNPLDRRNYELARAVAALEAGTAVFNPGSLSGMVLRLAADISPKWQDLARTIPAIADGDPVRAAEDLSGLGNHVTCNADAARPLLKLAIQNGRAVLRFDGTNDFLETTAVAWPAQLTAFVVYPTRTGVNGGLLGLSTAAHIQRNTTLFYNSAQGSVNLISTLNAHKLAAFRYDFTGSTFALWLDGVADITSVAAWVNPGGTLVIGARSNVTEFLAGDIAEVILYNRLLTTPERVQVQNALGTKWGITVA